MNQLTGKEWEVEGLQIICCKNGVIILWEKRVYDVFEKYPPAHQVEQPQRRG